MSVSKQLCSKRSMSLDIGSRCSCCDAIDFLPTLCHCGKTFCQQHISPDSHLCLNDSVSKDSPSLHDRLIPCSISECTRHCISSYISVPETSKVTLSCDQCQRTFCVYHRHPVSHQCPKRTQSSRTEDARVLLAKHFPAAATSPRHPNKNKGIQQSKQVSLMRMRLRALPGDPQCNNSSVPSNQRLFIRIRGPSTTESMYWFHKDTVTGKVLDSLTSKLNLRTSDTRPFYLFSLDETTVPSQLSILRNDLPISQQVQNDSLLVIQTLT
ncbi:hypothetical protein M378DRAFT_678430 [Amanita muscaria Koide BX008]|uniref:AN1-type domain-containing protein n=1 Tax=Amanita muscaria (strain Koide BX008) TaxID=946122 RepID=A0A0C2XJ99_AMAMK|nr:hypothetical protein M378DRAFT_678430 [Amanita muscaria Koide BX008]